jgi:hypothetical protein
MWEPRRLTTLWAFTVCYRDSFTFTLPFIYFQSNLLFGQWTPKTELHQLIRSMDSILHIINIYHRNNKGLQLGSIQACRSNLNLYLIYTIYELSQYYCHVLEWLYKGSWIGYWLYWRFTGLQINMTLSLIPTLYKIMLSFPVQSVITTRFLVTAFNNGYSSGSVLKSSLNCGHIFQPSKSSSSTWFLYLRFPNSLDVFFIYFKSAAWFTLHVFDFITWKLWIVKHPEVYFSPFFCPLTFPKSKYLRQIYMRVYRDYVSIYRPYQFHPTGKIVVWNLRYKTT